MMVRDEIAGWLMGMDAYNPAGRASGSRPMAVDRIGLSGASTAQSRSRSSVWLSRSMAARSRNACSRCRPAPTTGYFPASYGCGLTPSRSGLAQKRRGAEHGRSRPLIETARARSTRRVTPRTRSSCH